MGLEINILINKMQRVPFSKIQEMLRDNEEEFDELSFASQNAILNFIEKRYNIA